MRMIMPGPITVMWKPCSESHRAARPGGLPGHSALTVPVRPDSFHVFNLNVPVLVLESHGSWVTTRT
jgi:hypothetical protein